MRNEFGNSRARAYAGTEGLPAPPFAFGKELTGQARSSQEVRSVARSEAQGWKATTRKKGAEFLRRQWAETAASIRDVLYASGGAENQVTDPAVGELQGNARTLETVLGDTRELPRHVRRLPEVETGAHEAITRVYVAVQAYLHAVRYKFQEDTFVTFFSGIQDIQALKLDEIWVLKLMLQFVLLEQVGRSSQFHASSSKRRESSGQSAEEQRLEIVALISSLGALGSAEWREINERISEVDRILRGDPGGAYSRMAPESRDVYLKAIQQLGAYSGAEETEIARRAIALASSARNDWSSNPRVQGRRSHVGFYLIGEGRASLESQIAYNPPFREQVREAILAWPTAYYFGGIAFLTFAVIAFLLIGARTPLSLFVGFVLLSLPATEAAWGMMNQLTAFILPPRLLPKLKFSDGIPAEYATMVVVPTLVVSDAYVRRMVRELEVRYLANRDANLYFALLTDAPDSQLPFDQSDELVSLASNLVKDLNRRYAQRGGAVFFLFHRFRTFNPSEESWMGWERKRGKLLDLNELLRGHSDRFPVKVGDLSVLPRIKYVITLDADTQLPRDVARDLVATLAHPLNRAVIDPMTNTVVEGYGMLQPRVGISVQSASRSLLASIYSGQTGLDLYTRAISDVYQDLFGEGSFAGKGIYEVDTVRQVLGQRFPCNAILSHDLIEGAYARSGLVSDIEVIDDYPTQFSAYSRRKHRWVRGDWQIMLWLLPRVRDALGRSIPNPLSLLSRWKILDNLRRSLVEIATFVLLLAGWLSLPGSPTRWTLVVLVLLLIPTYLKLAISLLRVRPGQNLQAKLKEIADDFVTDQINVFFMLAFLSHQMLVMLDAIIRTVVRVTITRKKLLEWETAAQAEIAARETPVDLYLAWTPWLSVVIGATVAVCHPAAFPAAAPLLVLWALAGPLAHWLNRPLPISKTRIARPDEKFLRSACLRTWRFFDESAKNSPHGLVPDNIQETPPRMAQRISPTNLGMQLNAQLAAYELGYLTLPEFVDTVERTLETAQKLPRLRGHFFNWHDTQTLEPLDPLFVSTADSGNLACSLWTLKQGCLKAIQDPLWSSAAWQGWRDHINLLNELASGAALGSPAAQTLGKINAHVESMGEPTLTWAPALPAIEQDLRQFAESLATYPDTLQELRWWTQEAITRTQAMRDMVEHLAPWLSPEPSQPVPEGTPAGPNKLTLRSLASPSPGIDTNRENLTAPSVARLTPQTWSEQFPGSRSKADELVNRLNRLAEIADRLVEEMDFRFLYNPSRKLLSLGYDVNAQQIHSFCYDLLASEARSAIFAAIAKGDIPQECWLHLGRTQTTWNGQRVLLSWSGTMFEYLMPTVWFNHYPRTILGETVQTAVQCQREWMKEKGLPWGISEAAYSAQDAAGNYQYRAFGLPALALDPACKGELVISPYSAFLALAVDPAQAVQNLRRMSELNWSGVLGFYDSADFASARVAPQEGHNLVRCWMAHHQGMSLLAACNLLKDGAIQKLFHSEPAVSATELLLHEKLSLAIKPMERGQRAVPGRPRTDLRQRFRNRFKNATTEVGRGSPQDRPN